VGWQSGVLAILSVRRGRRACCWSWRVCRSPLGVRRASGSL